MSSRRFLVSILGLLLCSLAHEQPARAAHALGCPSPNDALRPRLPLHLYVPPLIATTPYNMQQPGRLAEGHLWAIREAIRQSLCAAQGARVPYASLRFTVYARTDEIGARAHILQALRNQGISTAQLAQAGRSVVDAVAAWHRARIVVEQFQIELARTLVEMGGLQDTEPTTMVEPAELTVDGPGTTAPVLGEPASPPPRSFIIVVGERQSPTLTASGINPSLLQGNGPPTIQVQCCNSCETSHGTPEQPAAARRSWKIQVGIPHVETLIGVAIATQPYTRTYLYRELSWLGLGFRLPINRFEFGARLIIHAGGHEISYNDIPQEQLRLGIGVVVRPGVKVIDSHVARLTLGLEMGAHYLFRRIDRQDYPYRGIIDTKHVLAPLANTWLRADVPLPVRRLAFSAEAELGFTPISTEIRTAENLTVTLLGGVSYALR